MTQARRNLISLSDTLYYHVINRCVRRAFLCGEDRNSGQSYEHRRQWIVDKLKELSAIFSINICAYSILSNHYHAVLHVDRARALAWSDDEVTARWKRLFRGNLLVDRLMKGESSCAAEEDKARESIGLWRERLSDISWFMRCLNEHIAREANREDGCKGRFWEGRFKSQALLDETGLLACMAYVDLNPIRAGLAETPEGSDFTSIQERIRAYSAAREARDHEEPAAAPASPVTTRIGCSDAPKAPLAAFMASPAEDNPALPFNFADYLELVDWTGRAVRADKRGAIPEGVPPILVRLGLAPGSWVEAVQHFRRHFFDHVGPARALQQRGRALGRGWLRGVRACHKLLGNCADTLNATTPHGQDGRKITSGLVPTQ